MFSSIAIPRKSFLRSAAAIVGAAFLPSYRTPVQQTPEASPHVTADRFAERILSDTAAAMLSFGAYIGDRLGLYRTMAEAGSVTIAELASKTHFNERYLREWLALMSTANYIAYDPKTSKYRLPREHATVLCDEKSPLFMGGFIECLACIFPINKIIDGFRGGKGPVSEDYAPEHWEGIERSTAPSYRNFLTQTYLPAMPDISERLQKGGAALDLGCGGGIASIAIARAYPKAEIFGLDVFAPSIEKARKNAVTAGLGSRIQYDTYDGITLPAERFDLITVFYSLHHLTDPVKVLTSVRKALRRDGACLIMEANVPEKLEESIGNTYANWNYGESLFYCMSTALSDGAPGYGAAIRGSEIKMLGETAGFNKVHRLPVQSFFDALYEFRL